MSVTILLLQKHHFWRSRWLTSASLAIGKKAFRIRGCHGTLRTRAGSAPARAQVQPFKHNLTEQKIAEMREAFSSTRLTLKTTYTSNEGSVIEPHVDIDGGVSNDRAAVAADLIIVHMKRRRSVMAGRRDEYRPELPVLRNPGPTRPPVFSTSIGRGSIEERTCGMTGRMPCRRMVGNTQR